MTRDEHVPGFKSCECCRATMLCHAVIDISIYWWIWMLSFLLKDIWIGIDYFLLNLFAIFVSFLGLQITVTFGSVLGLQVTVGLQVYTGLQPPTRWVPSVAGTLLRHPEPTKERVKLTIFSLIAMEIRHLTRLALLLLLQILRYMWRNHVATWAQANNSGKNLNLNKMRFSRLHYIFQYKFWFGLESEKFELPYWYLEKTQGHSMTPTAIMTMRKYYIKPL